MKERRKRKNLFNAVLLLLERKRDKKNKEMKIK